MPLPVIRGIAWISELVARFTHRPPLITTGGLYFVQWQARPLSEKAQRELGWEPTPLPEGLRKTIEFLNKQSSDSDAASK
jgi:nucleoside-diphosphate-sugar epimerase